MSAEYLEGLNIIGHDFPLSEYIKEETDKKQIVLHHTISPGHSVTGDIAWWIKLTGRIATPIIIDNFGNVHRLFSSKYWAYHLGIASRGNRIYSGLKTSSRDRMLNKMAIGVELDCLGPLKQRNGKWYSVYGHLVDESKITFYSNGFRGYEAFESYTKKQIDSLRQILLYWNSYYNIPINYRSDIWDINEDALKGVSGLYTHVSYRTDKSDCHPQKELIQMLKSL